MNFGLGAVKAIKVSADGWSAWVTLQGLGRTGEAAVYKLDDQGSPGLTLSVTDLGGDTRDVVATRVVRKPFPDENELDHRIAGGDLMVRVALSEFVFASSQIVANSQPGWVSVGTGANAIAAAATEAIAVENKSELKAVDAAAIANFVTPDRQLVAGFIQVEVVAGSVFAEAGAEVAAVRFVASDEHGNQTSVLVDQATLSTWGKGDARPVYSYGAKIATTGLTDGDLITVRAEVIDHLGQIRTSAPSGSKPGNPTAFVDQVYRLDTDGSFGKSFAYVDAGAASDAGIVSADPTVAAATPFRTIAGAMKAAQVFDQQVFGRNNLDNAEIRLKAGTHVWVNGPLTTANAKTDDVWVTITRDPLATREEVRLTGAVDGKNTFGFADHIKIEGLTIDRAPMGTVLSAIMRGQAEDALWLHDVAFEGRDVRAPSFRIPDVWVTQSDFVGTSRALTTFGSDHTMFRIRGIEATAGAGNIINGHLLVGSDLHDLAVRFPVSAVMPGASGSVIAYNEISTSTSTNLITVDGIQGIAILGNTLAAISGVSSAARLSGDGAIRDMSNVVFHHNTVLNERVNVGYNDVNGENWSKTLFSLKWNDLHQLNTKHDVFSRDSDNSGGWSVLYGVGFEGNIVRNKPAGPQISFGFTFDGLGASGNGLLPLAKQSDVPDVGTAVAQPVGTGDVFVASEDTVLDVPAPQGVLANDSSPSGELLLATLAGGPTNGTLLFRADGSFVYTPSLNFNGTDSFTYTVEAGGASAGPVTVTVEVQPVNDAPIFVSPADVSIAENATAAAVLAAIDPDAGSSLVYSIAGGADAARFTLDPASGALSFVSPPDFETPADAGSNNVYDVIVRTSDGALSTDRALVVSVTNANEAPIAQADSLGLDARGATGNLWANLLANDSDIDTGDTRTIVGVDVGGMAGTITFDSVSQILSYAAPAANQSSTDAFRYTIRDAGGLTSTATVTVTITGVNEIINGTAGADSLVGSINGRDLYGLAGNDTYVVLSANDRVFEAALTGSGIDTIQTALTTYLLPDNVENLTYTGTSGAVFTGNALANIIIGGGGDNILDGGGGSDRLTGGLGNDTYVVDRAGTSGDILSDAGGIDTVRSWISWTLANGFENLELLGGTNGTGNAGDNVLRGNAGNNILDGRGGADTMIGGAGNDIYLVDNTQDLAIEIIDGADGGGIDLVRATVDWTLADGIENLQFIGAAGTAFRGNGNSLANVITGGSGADLLLGLGGNDTLSGGVGEDFLDGGSGADRLAGGQGNDVFVLRKGEADGDVITDFIGRGSGVGDSILLAGWSAGTTLVNQGLSAWRITDGIDGTVADVTITGSVFHSDVLFG